MVGGKRYARGKTEREIGKERYIEGGMKRGKSYVKEVNREEKERGQEVGMVGIKREEKKERWQGGEERGREVGMVGIKREEKEIWQWKRIRSRGGQGGRGGRKGKMDGV